MQVNHGLVEFPKSLLKSVPSDFCLWYDQKHYFCNFSQLSLLE